MGYSTFTKEFKAEAVTLLCESKKPVKQSGICIHLNEDSSLPGALDVSFSQGFVVELLRMARALVA